MKLLIYVSKETLMLTFREIKSKKIPYEQLDAETKEYVYDTFQSESD